MDPTRRLVFAGLFLLMCAACASKTEEPVVYRGVMVTPPRPKPDFTFTSTSGAPYRFRQETDGKLTLLFFGYTYCPDICPLHMANIAAVLKKLPATDRERVKVVFVTTDPARDTPERLRTWLANFDSSFVGVAGRMEDVNRLQQSMGMPPATPEAAPAGSPAGAYGIAHGAAVLAFTADDSLRTLYPFGIRQEDWAADIPQLLKVKRRMVPGKRGITVSRVVAPAPVNVGSPSDATMAVYAVIESLGDADTLSGVESPAARAASVHETMDHGGSKMMMRAESVPVTAGATVRLVPGGTHIMLEGLARQFAPGDSVPLTLLFRRAGRVPVTARVVGYDQLERAIAP